MAIISSPRDNEMVKRNWPYLKVPGWTILGCGTTDGKCEWPEPVERLDTGAMGTKMTQAGSVIYGLVQQELDIWKWFLKHPEFDSVCVVESDNIFVRKPPEHPGGGLYLVTALPNYSRHGLFRNPVYFSTPRWADRQCAELLYTHGRNLIQSGQTEWDVSDRFPSMLCHRFNIPWLAQPAWSPSALWKPKDFDASWIRDARAAIKLGVYAIHGIKHQWQLDAIKDLLP